MKVKGRADKWIPGRSRSPQEEGAIGGEGNFRSTMSDLAAAVSVDDNNEVGVGEAETAESSGVGDKRGRGLNRLDSTLLEDVCNLQGGSGGITGGAGGLGSCSSNNSCTGEEFELLTFHRNNNHQEDDDGISAYPQVEVGGSRKYAGSSEGVLGVGGGGRRRVSVEYMKVDQVCTMNIPTDHVGTSGDNAHSALTPEVAASAADNDDDVTTPIDNQKSVTQIAQGYFRSLRKSLSLRFLSRDRRSATENTETTDNENNARLQENHVRQRPVCNGAVPKKASQSGPGDAHGSSPGDAHGSRPGAAHVSSPGGTHVSSPGNTHVSSPGNTHVSSPGAAHVSSPGNTHVSNPGNTHVSNPRNTHVSSPGNTHVSSPGNTHVSSPGDAHMSSTGDVHVVVDTNITQTRKASAGSAMSPDRKVTFDETTLGEAESREVVCGTNVRIVRVRDASVDTSDGPGTSASMDRNRNGGPRQPPNARQRSALGDDDDDDDDDSSDDTLSDVTSSGYVRHTWSGKLDFLVSTLGYAVGLGNVCRFPYLCYKNGGGAFLLPYFIFVVLVGIPLVFLEVSFGQFAGLGPISIWNISPIFKGIGMAMVVLSLVVSVYYNVLLSWTIFYLCASMQHPLPWTSCNNSWNTQACCTTRFYSIDSCADGAMNSSISNSSCGFVCGDDLEVSVPWAAKSNSTLQPETSNATTIAWDKDAYLQYSNKTQRLRSPAEEYFSLYVMGGPQYSGALGGLRWHLALCLLLSTLIVFLCLIRGPRSSSKVTYVTVASPYLILLVILVKTAMLEGANKGISFYMSPQWHRLKDPQVWHDAMNQVFFSLAPCYGGLLSLASFNKFNNNCYRDALFIPIANCLTSVFAGFPVFCTLGFMAHKLGTDISNVVTSGWGLAFIVYPEAVSNLPLATFWSILFFLMIFALGIDSLLGFVVTIVVAIMDELPRVLLKWRLLVLMAVCLVLVLLGLPLVTQGGVKVLELLDRYATSYPPVVVGILECVVLMWVYGYTRFSQDVWYMFGKQPGRWWRLLWQFVTPALLLFLLIFSSVAQNLVPSDEQAPADGWTVAGWAVAGACILPVPAYAVYAAISTPGTFVKRWRRLLRPAEGWGVFPEGCDMPAVPDYIRSDETHPEEVVASVGDIPELPPRPEHTGDPGDPTGDAGGMDEDDTDTESLVWSEDENKERGNWHGRYDFFMSGIGYTVGLGNVWRFPYLVYKNGGGAFFLPYILMLILCGVPLFFMELSLGQFASAGSLSIWRLSPLFKGLGFASCITVSLLAVYYNAMTSWSIYYFCASMTSELPWATCTNTWNTPACRVTGEPLPEPGNTTALCGWNRSHTNHSIQFNCTNTTASNTTSSPSEEYFFRYVLNVSSGIDDLGTIQWPLALCLLASSLISFAALIKGVKSIGKVVYLTVTFPYLILLILLARYVTLGSGHLEGIKFYLTPNWSRLSDTAVWGDAASQLFFSLGLSMGGLMSLASYNRFHYDCYRDAYLICLVDTLTSVFAGFVIFAILGVMAAEKGTDVQSVITSKFALAFIVYPEAVTKLPIAPFWSVLFFLMLFTLAIDSQFLMTGCLVISITDEFPSALGPHRVAVIAAVCSGLYLLGLPMATQGGFYMVVLFDQYVAAWTPVVVAILTCVTVCWVYGMPTFINNVRAMLGSPPSYWFQTLWQYVIPVVFMLLLVFVWANYRPPSLDDYYYPDWAHGLGLVLGLGPLLAIPLVAMIQVCRTPGSGLVIVRRCMAPSEAWGPALKRHRVHIFVPNLPDLEPTWSTNWMAMAKEMSIYATETSAMVAMSSYKNIGSKVDRKRSREKTVTIATSGVSSDKNIQTDGGLIEEDSIVVVSPCRKKPACHSTDASTQTLNQIGIEEEYNGIHMVTQMQATDHTNMLSNRAAPSKTSYKQDQSNSATKKSKRKSSKGSLESVSSNHSNSTNKKDNEKQGKSKQESRFKRSPSNDEQHMSSSTSRGATHRLYPTALVDKASKASNLGAPEIRLDSVGDTGQQIGEAEVLVLQPVRDMSYLNIDPCVDRQYSRETNVSVDQHSPCDGGQPAGPLSVNSGTMEQGLDQHDPHIEGKQTHSSRSSLNSSRSSLNTILDSGAGLINSDTKPDNKPQSPMDNSSITLQDPQTSFDSSVSAGSQISDPSCQPEADCDSVQVSESSCQHSDSRLVAGADTLRYIDDSGSDLSDPDVMDTYL